MRPRPSHPRRSLPRRSLIRRLGLTATVGVLAGCTAEPGPTAESDQSAEYDPGRVGEHTTRSDGSYFPGGPKDPPDRPESLTEESVDEYVREYERRYVYNKLWMGENSTVGVTCTIDAVESIDGGYRVDVACSGSAKKAGGTPAEENGTTTEVIADYFKTPATYYVDEDTTIRQAATVI